MLAGGGTGRTCAAGKWCTSPRELNREERIYFIGRGQKTRSRRHRGVTPPFCGGRDEDGEPGVTGVTRNSSNQFQSIRELPETPPINSNQFVSFKNKGLARPSARSPPPARPPACLASPRHATPRPRPRPRARARARAGPGWAAAAAARARACGIQVILFYFSNGSANDQVFK